MCVCVCVSFYSRPGFACLQFPAAYSRYLFPVTSPWIIGCMQSVFLSSRSAYCTQTLFFRFCSAQMKKMRESIECARSAIAVRLRHPERQQLALKDEDFAVDDHVNPQYLQDRRLSKCDVHAPSQSRVPSQDDATASSLLLPGPVPHEQKRLLSPLQRMPTVGSFFPSRHKDVVADCAGTHDHHHHRGGEARRASSPEATALMPLSGDTVLRNSREW